MFTNNGKDNGTKAAKNGTSASSSVNLIGVGTSIEGEIKSEGDIRIDGQINGTVISNAKIVVGTTGRVEGDLLCQSADISGKIKGKVKVGGLLFLKGQADITGNISSSKLVVEGGAVFNGTCTMGSNGTTSKQGTDGQETAESPKTATA